MKVDIYTRYSRKDGDKQSDSIENQLNIVRRFVVEKGWEINEEHIDDDYSGTNYMRPGFQKMIENIKQGNCQGIVCKDQSRFGRNVYNEYYFEELFPLYGAFFIGVVDKIDTRNEENVLVRQISSVMNENYSRDISNKVKAALKSKMLAGKFIGTSVPYGFQRHPDDKNILIIDEKVKPVIHEIGKLYLQGYGFSTIAKILNDRGEPCPTKYKQMQGYKYKNPNAKMLWSACTIRRILTDEVYHGVLTQGKQQVINFKLKKKIYSPKKDVIRVEGAVPKIFDDKTWELIKKQVKIRSRQSKNCFNGTVRPSNFYSGILYCKDCGSKMKFRSDYQYYTCGTYAKYGKKLCPSHRIQKDIIDKVCLDILRRDQKIVIDIQKKIKELESKERTDSKVVNKRLQEINYRLEEIKLILKQIREEKIHGLMNEKEYIETREEYKQEETRLKNELFELENKNRNFFESWKLEHKDIYERFNIKEINREIVLREFEKIIIDKEGKIVEIIRNGKSPEKILVELS